MTEKQHKSFLELLKDATKCARLTPWEENWLTSMRAKVDRAGRSLALSDKEQVIAGRIEAKVYAT